MTLMVDRVPRDGQACIVRFAWAESEDGPWWYRAGKWETPTGQRYPVQAGDEWRPA